MIKRIATAVIALAAGFAQAADFVSVDIDHVKGANGAGYSEAQYVRAGKEIAGIQYGLQSRTSVANTGGMFNSLELTAGKNLGVFSPFVGVGHDNGLNGAVKAGYTYGLVGGTTGAKIGPGFALLGVKTRVLSTEDVRTKQTVAFSTYSIPLTKAVDANINLSKSYQDIQERAWGLGVAVKF